MASPFCDERHQPWDSQHRHQCRPSRRLREGPGELRGQPQPSDRNRRPEGDAADRHQSHQPDGLAPAREPPAVDLDLSRACGNRIGHALAAVTSLAAIRSPLSTGTSTATIVSAGQQWSLPGSHPELDPEPSLTGRGPPGRAASLSLSARADAIAAGRQAITPPMSPACDRLGRPPVARRRRWRSAPSESRAAGRRQARDLLAQLVQLAVILAEPGARESTRRRVGARPPAPRACDRTAR